MKIEILALSKIKPYPRNPRKIPQKAIDKVAASLLEFGWQQPIVVDKKRVIVVGHTRYLAALGLGWTEAPVHVASKLTAAQVNAYRLADNRTGEEAGWNIELLGAEMMELKAMDFNLSLTGFNIGEIGRLLPASTDEPEAQIDRAEELQGKWKVERGQVWEIGGHRLMCGDSTSAQDVAELLAGVKWNLMATDPPYLVDYTGGRHPQSWSNSPEVKDKHWDDYHDPKQTVEFYAAFLGIALAHASPGCAVYQWHAALVQWLVHQAWLKCGLLVHQHIVWVKARAVLTHSHYMWQHEVAFYGWPKGSQPKERPPANERTVWQIDQAGDSDGHHPTQKPVELFQRPIKYHTAEGEVCYEPFGGSGTQFVAAQQLGRRCYGMEIEPKYCSVILERMSAMGLTPKLITSRV